MMFYTISDDFLEQIEIGEPSAIDFVDYALTAHRMGHFILALSKRHILRLSQVAGLSKLSERMLSFISNKSIEYYSAMKKSVRVVNVCTSATTNSFHIDGQLVNVNYRCIGIYHALTQKFVLAEAPRDLNILRLLVTVYMRHIGYPENLISFRQLSGGGGALCQLLELENISPVKGIVMCDADTHVVVPPFPHNSTAAKAMEKAISINLLDEHIGISNISPYFAFIVTGGRTIENMIHPHLVDRYFHHNSQSRTKRAAFVSAFPNFPNLNEAELRMWVSLNLKVGTPNIALQIAHVRELSGHFPNAMLSRTAAYASLSYPSDLLDWVIVNWDGTRHSRMVKNAVHEDLKDAGYRRVVADWAMTLAYMGAGDTSASRS